jgi:hypothetical protein
MFIPEIYFLRTQKYKIHKLSNDLIHKNGKCRLLGHYAVWFLRTDVSEELIPSIIIRVTRTGKLRTRTMVSSGLLRRVALVRTDVSEEPGASFIRVTKMNEGG